MTETDVAVVGAGITGLALAWELDRRGVDARVLEAADRPGGVVRSLSVEGRVLEAGPQRTRMSPPVARLVEALELEDRLLVAARDLALFVLRDGRLRRVPTSPGELLTGDLLTWRGKLRVLLEPLVPRRDDRGSVAAWTTRRLGREAYRCLVGPFVGGLYASDPAEMPVERTLMPALERAGLADGSLVLGWVRRRTRRGDDGGAPPVVSFREGMQELTDALHRRVRSRVHLSTPAREVRRTGGGPEGTPGWRVETGDGTVRARRVVLTCPADDAAGLLGGAAPDAARRLAGLRYNRLAVVHLVGDCGLRGYGYQVALGEGTATRGATWNASLFGRGGVHTAYLGGALRPEVAELPDREVGEIARREFHGATGCETRVLRVGRARMPAWDRSWRGLGQAPLPPGLRICANYVSRAGIPGRLREARETAGELAAAL